MISLGIDNGNTGALVAVNEKYQLIGYRDTPVVQTTKAKRGGKKSIKIEVAPTAMKAALVSLLTECQSKDCGWVVPGVKIWLEVAQAMPQQGLSSTFKTGRGFGLWEGIVVGMDLPYDIVHAKTWTKVMLHDVPVGDPKDRSMIKAQRLFGSKLPLVKPMGRVLSLDGRADASLIAYYGMSQMLCVTPQFQTTKRPVPKRVP